jgi:hypothetical protein
VHFAKVDVEKGYDFVRIKGAGGEVTDELSGTLENYTTDYIAGDQLNIEFSSDGVGEGYGFAIDRYEVIE